MKSSASVQQKRKSSLQLRRGSQNQDSTPVSVVYKPGVDTVELNNVADGTTTIDASDPPISDLVSSRLNQAVWIGHSSLSLFCFLIHTYI